MIIKMYRYNVHNIRKFQYSISSILETNKRKYNKNQYIIRRKFISNVPPEDPFRYIVLLLFPILINVLNNIKKSH